MAQFNPKDPLYQRDLQRLNAKGSMSPQRGVARARVGALGGQHAGSQLQRQQTFRRLGIASDMAKSRHELNLARSKQRDKELDLSRDKLDFNKKSFKDRLKDEKRAMNFTIASGIGGAVYSAYEGNRRAKVLQAELVQRNQDRDLIRSIMTANSSFRRGRTDEGALIAARSLGRLY